MSDYEYDEQYSHQTRGFAESGGVHPPGGGHGRWPAGPWPSDGPSSVALLLLHCPLHAVWPASFTLLLQVQVCLLVTGQTQTVLQCYPPRGVCRDCLIPMNVMISATSAEQLCGLQA